jgi:acetyl esterase/lipase
MIFHDTVLAGVAVRHFRPARAACGQLLFLHGGGFTLGSVRSHHGIQASLLDMQSAWQAFCQALKGAIEQDPIE